VKGINILIYTHLFWDFEQLQKSSCETYTVPISMHEVRIWTNTVSSVRYGHATPAGTSDPAFAISSEEVRYATPGNLFYMTNDHCIV
jgi:hypothetical protein